MVKKGVKNPPSAIISVDGHLMHKKKSDISSVNSKIKLLTNMVEREKTKNW